MSETKYVRILQITALLTLVGTAAPSAMAGKPSSGIVVDCVGDSITAGYNLAGNQSYPSQLAGMLGSNYIVNNFGVSSTTMLKNGNYSYWGTRTYSNSLRSSPKYVIIAFGTNDSKSYNWDTHGSEFVGDYQSMISSYATLNSQPTVFVTYITPYYLPNPWPSDFPDPTRIPNLINPAIQQVVTSTGSPSIDDYNPFVNQPQLFGDGIHPTVDGAHIITRNVYNAVTGANLSVLKGAYISDGNGPGGGVTANGAASAFDVNSNTYYDAAQASGAWTGIDLGSTNTKSVRMICYSPRAGYESRMVGGAFQGSNDQVNWTNLATISTSPGDTYTSIPIAGAPVYRYLRYYSGANCYGNVAEVEFLGK